MNNLMVKGGIGIIKSYTNESAFQYFKNNSKIRLLSDSSFYGIIFEFILNNGVDSPYYSLRSNDILQGKNTSIRNLICKVCVISDIKKKKTMKDLVINYYLNKKWDEVNKHYYAEYDKRSVTPKEFLDEVKMQMDIYNSSNEHLEPICPSIVFSKIYQYYDADDFFDPPLPGGIVESLPVPEVFELDSDHFVDKESFKKYSQIFKNDYTEEYTNLLQIGIIVMEYSCEGKTVYPYIKQLLNNKTKQEEKRDTIQKKITGNKKKLMDKYNQEIDVLNKEISNHDTKIIYFLILLLFEHYRLYLLGYLHGDSHLENALYCENYQYTSDLNNRSMLIDFGMTQKFSSSIQKNIKLIDFCNFFIKDKKRDWVSWLIPFIQQNQHPMLDEDILQKIEADRKTYYTSVENDLTSYTLKRKNSNNDEKNSQEPPLKKGGNGKEIIKEIIESEKINQKDILLNLKEQFNVVKFRTRSRSKERTKKVRSKSQSKRRTTQQYKKVILPSK